MAPFGFRTATDIRFGRGQAASALPCLAKLGTRVLLVRSASVPWADTLADYLQDAGCAVSLVVARGEPDLAVVEAARVKARAIDAQAVIAVGGGSTIDLGKAVAALVPAQGEILDYLEGVGGAQPLIEAPLRFTAIPSTAGTGAEVTKNAVIAVPDRGRKVSLRDDRMLPDLAIVDPDLTDGSPRRVTLASGLDAITQVIEPFLSLRANPLTDALCAQAIPMGLKALTTLTLRECPRARDDLAFVSLCGGVALANAGLGAVHGLAGVIGGRTGAPHGLICGRLLGPVLRANKSAVRAVGMPGERFEAVTDWMSQALKQPRDRVLKDWSAILDALGVDPLSGYLTDPDARAAIAAEAAGASSIRANPVVLTPQTLERVMAVT
ncbi:MAG: iron-containing alcohol dehydrogenase [Pseudomonadota bacterium]